MTDITKLIEALKQAEQIEMENIEIIADELELMVSPLSVLPALQKAVEDVPRYSVQIFEKPPVNYRGEVTSVKLGNTKAEGGTRSHSITVGGDKAMPFESGNPSKPAVAFDVFDMKIPLPGPVRMHFEEVLEDPVEWAKLCVDKYGADMVTIHLISTDPGIKDTTAREAAKTVEELLQAVKVPMIIGGSGNPDKDPEVLKKAAEAAQGERCLINSVGMNLDYKKIGSACLDNGHAVLSWTQLDVNNQKTMNKRLFELGLKKEDIIMDPTTAPLGYGLEFSFSTMEKIRLAALKGDDDLQMPIASGTTNAWGAREAWMKAPEWGDREKRGPLWEAVTAMSLWLAGCNLFMMICPTSIELFKSMVDVLTSDKKEIVDVTNWIGL
ncbi:MAG: CO dehydrogenase/acetyl-CoA synthase subunit delta [Methanosarcinales archaeon Met12]|nr:MAG: CO dehydrogenase/acetyl-CoA synthase subunit delta [Methanosarcinales archaeon Met12]